MVSTWLVDDWVLWYLVLIDVTWGERAWGWSEAFYKAWSSWNVRKVMWEQGLYFSSKSHQRYCTIPLFSEKSKNTLSNNDSPLVLKFTTALLFWSIAKSGYFGLLEVKDKSIVRSPFLMKTNRKSISLLNGTENRHPARNALHFHSNPEQCPFLLYKVRLSSPWILIPRTFKVISLQLLYIPPVHDHNQ